MDFPVQKFYIYLNQFTRRVILTMPSFKCRDIGMDCPFEATAPTEAELMKKIAEHVEKAHGMKLVPPDVMAKIKGAIKN